MPPHLAPRRAGQETADEMPLSLNLPFSEQGGRARGEIMGRVRVDAAQVQIKLQGIIAIRSIDYIEKYQRLWMIKTSTKVSSRETGVVSDCDPHI